MTKDEILKGSKTHYKTNEYLLRKNIVATELQDGTIKIEVEYFKQDYTKSDSLVHYIFHLVDSFYIYNNSDMEKVGRALTPLYGSVLGFDENTYKHIFFMLKNSF